MEEHAIYIHGKVSGEDYGTESERAAIYALQKQLDAALKAQKAGEYDGNEFGKGTFKIFLYGSDANQMFALIEPILSAARDINFDRAMKRFGKDGAREEHVSLRSA